MTKFQYPVVKSLESTSTEHQAVGFFGHVQETVKTPLFRNDNSMFLFSVVPYWFILILYEILSQMQMYK